MSYFDTISISDGTDTLEINSDGSINVHPLDGDGNQVSAQYPLSVDGDQVYEKDIDVANSSIGDFSGSIVDLFNSRTSTITTETDNPSLTIALKRPVKGHTVTLVTSSGNFSNVTIVAKDAAGTTLETIDDSANNTDYTANKYNFTTIDQFCVLDISFTTTDTVTLGFCLIHKSRDVDAHLVALKPDGTDTHIHATTGGNLKVSLEELESGISSNSNSQLNVTIFDASGTAMPIGDLVTTAPFSKITDGTETLLINADGSSNVVADGSVQIDDGTDTLAINTDGSVNVRITDGTETLAIDANNNAGVVNYHSDGTAGALITGFDYVAGKSGIDASTESIQVVDYPHHEVHAGDKYFVQNYVDLAINHVLQFTFVTPNTTKWIHFLFMLDTEAETLWQIYEAGTITNPLANAITPLNNNRNSANTSGVTARYEDHANLAAADTDVDISGATLLAQGVSGAGRTGGDARRASEWVLKQNTIYVFRATATAAGYVNFDMDWYEHTDKN